MRIDNCIIIDIDESDDFYNIANELIGKRGYADYVEPRKSNYYSCRFYFEKGFYCKNCGNTHNDVRFGYVKFLTLGMVNNEM